MGLQGACPGVLQNSVRDAKYLGFFQAIKARHFSLSYKQFLTFPQWDKTSREEGQPSTSY
jgi:hypothetical protein